MIIKDRLLRLFLVVVMAGLGLADASSARAQFGVTAGLNFDRVSDITLNNVETSFDSKTGWHVGVWADISLLGILTIRPGARYMDAGQLYEGLSEIDPSVEDDFNINLLEIPVLVRFGFGGAVVKPYVFGGPVARFVTGVSDLVDDDIKSPTLAGEVGLGLQVSFGGIKLYPEIAFTFGLSNFIDDEIIVGFAIFTTDDTQKLNTAMLRLGVGL